MAVHNFGSIFTEFYGVQEQITFVATFAQISRYFADDLVKWSEPENGEVAGYFARLQSGKVFSLVTIDVDAQQQPNFEAEWTLRTHKALTALEVIGLMKIPEAAIIWVKGQAVA